MTVTSTPTTLPELRQQTRDLLNEFDAADGLASYYALHHDAQRTTLIVHRDDSDLVDGFLARCQTGIDLFRPLVTLRVRGVNDPIAPLLEAGLVAGRPYLMVIPELMVERVARRVALADPVCNRVMRLDPGRFVPEINVLVVTRADADGNPRAEVRRGDQAVATAGVNWRSPIFAEMFVRVEPQGRGRGWGRAVVKAVVGELLKQSVTPLYTVAEGNDASYDLAIDVGFVDSGAREVMAEALRE
jgi:GNAT superfamily N-acetyltransferase